MVKLVSDEPDSSRGDMVLEVDRLEDARTVSQRLRIPATQWREFLRAEAPGAAPLSVERAYLARKDFWDWLADEHADRPPGAPLDDPHRQPASPSAAWLSARYRDWQERS